MQRAQGREAQKNTDLEVLKAAIRAELEKLMRMNQTRADFAETFEELIESYKPDSGNIEVISMAQAKQVNRAAVFVATH